MIRINLIEYREQRKRQLIREQIIMACLICLPFIAGIILSYTITNAKIAHVKDQIIKTQQDIQNQKVSIKKINSFKAKKQSLLKKMEIIKTLQKSKSGPVHIMDELAVNLPGKLWLTSLEEKNMQLELQGLALDEPSISKYMINLEKSPYFKNVDLVKISTQEKTKKKGLLLKNFTLICTISYTQTQ